VVKEEFSVWVSGEPASVARTIARAVEGELAGTGATVVLSTGRPSASAGHGRPVVEVFVGAQAPLPAGGGSGPDVPGPDVVVPGDGARAGESARVVLRHLAAAGYTEPLGDYSDDDEAAVSVRLQAFGYL
jgi:hypothetical protein